MKLLDCFIAQQSARGWDWMDLDVEKYCKVDNLGSVWCLMLGILPSRFHQSLRKLKQFLREDEYEQ